MLIDCYGTCGVTKPTAVALAFSARQLALCLGSTFCDFSIAPESPSREEPQSHYTTTTTTTIARPMEVATAPGVAVNALIDRPSQMPDPGLTAKWPGDFEAGTNVSASYCPGNMPVKPGSLHSKHLCYSKCYEDQTCTDVMAELLGYSSAGAFRRVGRVFRRFTLSTVFSYHLLN